MKQFLSLIINLVLYDLSFGHEISQLFAYSNYFTKNLGKFYTIAKENQKEQDNDRERLSEIIIKLSTQFDFKLKDYKSVINENQNYLNLCLRIEIEAYQWHLRTILDTIKKIKLFLDGKIFANKKIDSSIERLLNDQVPDEWKLVNQSSNKLASWMLMVHKKFVFIKKWSRLRYLQAWWIGGILHLKSFFSAIKLNFAHSLQLLSSDIEFDFEMRNIIQNHDLNEEIEEVEQHQEINKDQQYDIKISDMDKQQDFVTNENESKVYELNKEDSESKLSNQESVISNLTNNDQQKYQKQGFIFQNTRKKFQTEIKDQSHQNDHLKFQETSEFYHLDKKLKTAIIQVNPASESEIITDDSAASQKRNLKNNTLTHKSFTQIYSQVKTESFQQSFMNSSEQITSEVEKKSEFSLLTQSNKVQQRQYEYNNEFITYGYILKNAKWNIKDQYIEQNQGSQVYDKFPHIIIKYKEINVEIKHENQSFNCPLYKHDKYQISNKNIKNNDQTTYSSSYIMDVNMKIKPNTTNKYWENHKVQLLTESDKQLF